MDPSAPPSLFPASRERLQAGLELVPIPAAHLLRTDAGWAVEMVNRAYHRTGLGAAEDSPMIAALHERLDAFLASDACNREFDWSLGAAIDCRHYQVSMARMSSAERTRCSISFVDTTQQINAERTLRREMTTDSLTGLPNRLGFADLIETVVATGPGSHAVLVVDLDRFGQVNACLGGLAGDELLMAVARRLQGALRACDTLARIGGAEFAVLVKLDGDAREAAALADRIQRGLRAPFRLTQFEIGIECSIGIALGAETEGEQTEDHEELIRHAQFAVKRAQASGRTETYQPQLFSSRARSSRSRRSCAARSRSGGCG